jgi:hypothetical protein
VPAKDRYGLAYTGLNGATPPVRAVPPPVKFAPLLRALLSLAAACVAGVTLRAQHLDRSARPTHVPAAPQ